VNTPAAVRRVVAVTAVLAGIAVALSLVPASSAFGALLAGPAPIPGFTLAKVGLLAAAAWWSAACGARLDAGHPARRPWALLALGFGGLAAGHLSLGVEQLAFAEPPYPFVSDLIFVPADAVLVAALFAFVAAYRSSGLFSDAGTRRAAALFGTTAVAVTAVLVITTLRLPVPWPARAVNVAYAVMDLGLLVPLALLVRFARLLGGPVGVVWRILLGGMMVFTAADVSIGYLDALGMAPSFLASQLPFVVAYGLAAAGSRMQLAVMEG
jgi:hypothetical protein